MKKIKILHLINSMNPGGAENLLASQLSYFNYIEFDITIGYLYGNAFLLRKNGNYSIANFSENSKFSYLSFWKILNYVKRNQINIIHTHLIQASLIGRLVSLLFPKIKCVTTRHYAKSQKKYRFINKLEEKTIKYSDRIICISEFVKNYLLSQGIDNYKLNLVYNGVDPTFFAPSSSDYRGELKIGSVGRLTHQKGMDVLIRSFYRINDQFPDLILEIIGEGELEEELKKLCNDLNILDKVIFLGKIPPHDVKDHLLKWKCFALASRWEAFGIVLLEAMAMEKPIVTTNAEAIPEVVKHLENGFICEIDDEICIADHISVILSDSQLAENFGKKSRQRVLDFFDIRVISKEIENVYKEIYQP